LQLVERSTGQRILLDGAHNVAGAAVLAEFVRTRFGNEKATVIPGILADKDLAGMCELLAPLAARIFPVTVASERTASPEDLAVICRELNPAASVIPCSSLSDALAAAQSDSLVIIAGSLYLVGEAMELLGLCPALTTDERGLNEWSREKSRTTTRT
jgi:dihydrofolate synthase/folylpolyglutamate synthase